MEPNVSDSSTIALALSGGGFRATLFHLGVIRYLRTVGRLQNVRHIAAVSGGSILAAHLAANWDLYTGSFDEFLRASDHLLKFTARDIRGRIVRRLPWLMLRQFVPRLVPFSNSLPRSTSDLFIKELQILYGDVNLADLLIRAPTSPRLSLLATNLTHPGTTSFENERVVNYPLSGQQKSWDGTSIPLHLAVACSAAYPGFFPPLAVSHEDTLLPPDYGVQYHSDGGVIDNQGMQLIFANKETDIIIVSDAASVSVSSQPTTHFGILTTGLRSMELMMAQIRNGHYARIEGNKSLLPIVVNIQPEPADLQRDHWGTVYNQLPQVRTDLDEFDAIERQELIHHGYCSTHEQLKWLEAKSTFTPPERSKGLPAKVARHLRSRAGFRLGMISWKDHVAFLNLFVVVFVLGALILQGPKAVRAVSDFMVIQRASELISKPLGIIPNTGEIPLEFGDTGKQPKNPGFSIIAEDRVWDLRNLQVSNKDATVIGPALMTRYTDLRREENSAREYVYRFETSGTLRAWKGIGDSRLSFRLIGPRPGSAPTAENGSSTLHVYKCIVDCSQIPVKEPFTIVVQAQYNDAFKKRENWWAGMIVSDSMKRVSMRIVFPSDLPFQNPSFRRYPNGSRLESYTFEGKALTVGGQPELLWTVSPPISDNTYRVNWDWYPRPG